MKDEPQILDYSKPPRSSGVADGFRFIGAAICVFTGLAGGGIIWYGAFLFLQLVDAPTRDRPHYIFVGSILSLIGLLVAGVSIRWLINAFRPKRKATIDRVG